MSKKAPPLFEIEPTQLVLRASCPRNGPGKTLQESRNPRASSELRWRGRQHLDRVRDASLQSPRRILREGSVSGLRCRLGLYWFLQWAWVWNTGGAARDVCLTCRCAAVTSSAASKKQCLDCPSLIGIVEHGAILRLSGGPVCKDLLLQKILCIANASSPQPLRCDVDPDRSPTGHGHGEPIQGLLGALDPGVLGLRARHRGVGT